MSKYAVLVLPFFIVSISITGPIITNKVAAENSIQGQTDISERSSTILEDSLLAQNYPYLDSSEESSKTKTIRVLVTAYSSSPEETDNTPLITASGTYVRYGVVAANFLPLGTKIRLPGIFGEQIFVVEDRLSEDYNDRVDVWFFTKEEALKFGYKISELEIL